MKKNLTIRSVVLLALLATDSSREVEAGELVATQNCDTNGDGRRDISDAIRLFSWLFTGGPPPVVLVLESESPLLNGDCNGQGGRDISDGIFLLAFLFLGGPPPVGPDEDGSGDAGEGPAVLGAAFPETLPAPVSVAVTPSEEEPPPDPLERIEKRFREIGAENLLVVRASIEELVASERVLPQVLYWGEVPHIVTTLTLQVRETYCGVTLKTVRASYVGGKLPDGKFERTEFMPNDLPLGEEHIFFLRQVDRECFLDLGREDMLRKDAQGEFRDPSANRISPDKLNGVCP